MYGAVRESETSLYMLYSDKNKTCTDKYGVPSGKIYSTHKPHHPYKREEMEREIPESGSPGQSRAFWEVPHTESFSDPPARPESSGQSC